MSAPLERRGESPGEPPQSAAQWTLRRNCSLSPAQMLCVYASLCVISLGIATYFWLIGATLVMPFAWAEVLAFGAALLAYARHAGDFELITLERERLTVEHVCGSRVERCELVAPSVQVGQGRKTGALIGLSARGREVQVGRYVRPERRAALAEEFRFALRRSTAPSG